MTRRSGNKAGGFSLVELLLTLVLLLCLAAASVFSYTALNRTASLDEGRNRMESLIRYAQAEAATTGCKVRLQFEEATPELEGESALRDIRVTWEPDFLNAPGVFKAYTNKAWSEEIVNEVVGVEEVRPIGPPAPRYLTETETGTGDVSSDPFSSSETAFEGSTEMALAPEFPGITFYPDGSCDSAELILASRNSEDDRRLEVRLSGILGSVSSRVISPSAEEDFLDEIAPESETGLYGTPTEDYGTVESYYPTESLAGSDLSSVPGSDYLQ